MKVKTTMRQMKDAKVSFISLVTRGANRIPFRVLKSESGESAMLNLSKMAHVFKNEPAPAKTLGFAAILRGSKPAPQPTQSVAKAAPVLQSIAKAAPVQSIAKPAQPQQQQRQQVAQQDQEERQRQGLAPNQPLQATPAPRRAGNTPKQPVKPSRDSIPYSDLQELMDASIRQRRKQDAQEDFNAKRSAFSQITPTQEHHVGRGGAGNAWALRNHGAQLGVQLLGGTDKPLPTNTAFRPFSAEGSKA